MVWTDTCIPYYRILQSHFPILKILCAMPHSSTHKQLSNILSSLYCNCGLCHGDFYFLTLWIPPPPHTHTKYRLPSPTPGPRVGLVIHSGQKNRGRCGNAAVLNPEP